MVVDTAGRAYVGNFGFDLMAGAPIRSTVLVRVDQDGTVDIAADDLLFPNGCVITSDGRLLVVAETLGQRLTAFDHGGDGRLTGRREWARFGDVPDTDNLTVAIRKAVLAPDGMCLDADGAVGLPTRSVTGSCGCARAVTSPRKSRPEG